MMAWDSFLTVARPPSSAGFCPYTYGANSYDESDRDSGMSGQEAGALRIGDVRHSDRQRGYQNEGMRAMSQINTNASSDNFGLFREWSYSRASLRTECASSLWDPNGRQTTGGPGERVTKNTDVFIIGGGPAGLACAVAARRRGLDVIVADGAEPPIDKACGEGMMPATLAALRELGIVMDSSQGRSLRGICFVNGADHAQ